MEGGQEMTFSSLVVSPVEKMQIVGTGDCETRELSVLLPLLSSYTIVPRCCAKPFTVSTTERIRYFFKSFLQIRRLFRNKFAVYLFAEFDGRKERRTECVAPKAAVACSARHSHY